MRKLYFQPLLFVALVLLSNSLFAQRKPSSVVTIIEGKRPVIVNTNRGAATGCDTLKFSESQSWTPVLFTWGINGGDGYVTGKNKFNDQQKGSFFDASSTQDSYLIKAWIFFGAAGSADLTKRIAVNVYDYNTETGNPGNLIGSTTISLQDIKTDVQNNTYTQVQFDPAVRLPDSKKFFITVEFTTLVWTNPAPLTGNDTLAIYSNKPGQSADNGREQTYSGSWETFSNGWGEDYNKMDLFIFPFTSADINCGLLPLKLMQFNAERKGKDVLVNWTVANEYDMLNYEVERADDNLTFKKIASVDAVNATSYTYSVTDKNVTGGSSGKVTYRLKQINKDGSFTYSSYVVVNIGEGFSITFENPVHNNLKLYVNTSSPQKIVVRMFDMQGKFTGIQQETVINTGNQVINLNGSASLSSGTYILDVLMNNEHKHYKVVKN